MKKRYFWVFLIMSLITLVELLSCIFFYFYRDRFTFYDFNTYVTGADVAREKEHYFDPDLGWDTQYDSPFGERPRLQEFTEDAIATFGDSYTHCDQVGHAETWQHFLSEKIEKNVFNYGVWAYGTDQAYLKFLKTFPKNRTKIVVLGLIPENINRIVSVYRPFYFPKTGVPLTKPRFFVNEDRLDLRTNPIKTVSDMRLLSDPHFLHAVGRNDYWYNKHNLPLLSFPFSAILFNTHFWSEVRQGVDTDIEAHTNIDLWSDNESQKIMFRIFDAFVSQALKNQSIPIILVLPTKDDVLDRYASAPETGMDTIVRYCRKKKYLCFDATVNLANRMRSAEDIQTFFSGHATAAGNEAIAEDFHDFLSRKSLV